MIQSQNELKKSASLVPKWESSSCLSARCVNWKQLREDMRDLVGREESIRKNAPYLVTVCNLNWSAAMPISIRLKQQLLLHSFSFFSLSYFILLILSFPLLSYSSLFSFHLYLLLLFPTFLLIHIPFCMSNSNTHSLLHQWI